MGYKLKKPFLLSELAHELSYPMLGADILITGVAPADKVLSSELTFTGAALASMSGVAVITSEEPELGGLERNGFVVTENPRLTFIKFLSFLEQNVGFDTWVQPASVDSSARIGNNVVIEEGCVVGANSIIEHNVVLHAGTRIGKNTRIRSCSSIGGDGFGFERMEDGTPLRFPHLGGVVIGDNVEIGALNSIARGTLSDTIIMDDVKTDNLVHIAHNCVVHEDVLITACAELSGGVTLGRRVWVGPNVSMMQKITVGDDALIGLGAVVTKSVRPKTIVAGNPAKVIREIK